MKIKNIINLIKYHFDKDENGFRNEVVDISNELAEKGNEQVAQYLLSLSLSNNLFTPQVYENISEVLKKVKITNDSLWLPDCISDDIIGIANAISHKVGVNKFIFEGKPGTGKTEATKQLARIINRELYMVDFNNIIDSKLGETQKNISKLFDEINHFNSPEHAIILFDEIDALAIDRVNNNDIREMGRATSTLLKELDDLNENVVVIATTNLYKNIDKALKRRFEFCVNFDRYTKEDLAIVSENILNAFLAKMDIKNKEKNIIKKIFNQITANIMPAELKNKIRSAIAFSNPDIENDYLKRLYITITGKQVDDIKRLSSEGFTTREIEILTSVPKSTVARQLNK